MSIPYTFQNQTGPIPLSELDANFTATRTDLANTSSPALGTGLVGWFKSLANFVGRTLAAKLSDQYSVCDYGAVGDGSTDNATFLANCPATDLLVPPGTYLVNSNTTIASNLRFAAGAILKPASGKTITLSNPFTAPPTKVFDLSLGGTIAVPLGMSDFCAEWWGAQGWLGGRTDNDVPFNQAIAAVATIVGPAASGKVTFERGQFYISNTINLANNVWVEGKGSIYSIIRANSPWPSNTPMILAQNGTISMFNCPVRKCRISAEDLPNVSACIYAPAWQQKSGTYDVYIERFYYYGIQLDTGYGGATQLTLEKTEVFASVYANTAYCIYANYPGYTIGFFTMNLTEVQCGANRAVVTFTSAPLSGATTATLTTPWPYATGTWNVGLASGLWVLTTLTNGSAAVTFQAALSSNAGGVTAQGIPPGISGVVATGNVIVACHDYHVEGATNAAVLQGGACLTGDTFTTDGNNSVQASVACNISWTGTVYLTGFQKCGSTAAVVDSNRPYNMAALQPVDGILQWPYPNYQCVASAAVQGTASPVMLWQHGKYTATPFTSIQNIGTGVTAISTTGWADGPGNTVYDVLVSVNDNVAVQACAYWNTSTQLYLVTRNSAGAMAYPSAGSPISVKLFRKP